MIKIGLLSTLTGPYQVPGEDGLRGAKLALAEVGYQVAGQPIELLVQGTNAMASSATEGARALLDRDAALIVGPLSGDEGVAMRGFARQHPDHTFINGVAASQSIYNPAPNFFSFSANGVQWSVGLGRFAYKQRGYRRIVTIGEAYSYPYAQIGGFTYGFCKAGGEIVKMLWCALGTEDYSGYIADIPDDAEAIYTTLGGTDGIAFLRQYRQQGQTHLPIIAGTICADQTLLHHVPDQAELLRGMLASGPVADVNTSAPHWEFFAQQYRSAYKEERFYAPSVFAYGYYVNMKAALTALTEVGGDLSGGQQHFQDALRSLTLDTPTGSVSLDRHQTAMSPIFITTVDVSNDGQLYTRALHQAEALDSTLGLSDEDYLAMGRFTRDNMPCMKKKVDPIQARIEALKKARGLE